MLRGLALLVTVFVISAASCRKEPPGASADEARARSAGQASPKAAPYLLKEGAEPGARLDDVELLGTLELPATLHPEGLHELSGLAWDDAAGLLYAVSDRGYLYHLSPTFEGRTLTGVEVPAGYPLLDEEGAPLKKKARDSEGLWLTRGEQGPELLVSFDKVPRVMRYDTRGRLLGEVDLAPRLRDVSVYDEDNHALEAVTVDEAGLLTAPERSLPGGKKGHIPLWRQDGSTAGVFVGCGKKRCALVALEALPSAGEGPTRLVILERWFDDDEEALESSLYLAELPPPAPPPGALVPARRVMRLSTREGYRHDNYEGLARHEGNRFFLVSDDNGGGRQRTLLTYLAIASLQDGEAPALGSAGGEEAAAP